MLKQMCGMLAIGILATFACSAAGASTQDGGTYTETFDGSDPAIMLNGTIDYGASGAWSVRIENGKLQLYDAEKGSALRYYTVPTLSLPGSDRVTVTDDADVEAVVKVNSEDRSGAGIIAGFDERRKDYLLFAIGPGKQVYVLQRRNGRAHVLAVRESEAVRSADFNTLGVIRTSDGLAFSVNGQAVMRVSRDDIPGRGIGIGAFGRGTYEFDSVAITPVGSTPSKMDADADRSGDVGKALPPLH